MLSKKLHANLQENDQNGQVRPKGISLVGLFIIAKCATIQ